MSGRQGLVATILFLSAVASVVFVVRALAQPHRALVDGVLIRGSPEFISRTREALTLLKTHCVDGYSQLTRHVLTIEEHEKSGANVWAQTIQVGKPTSDYSLTWYASSLVHDCRHISQYQDYLAAYPDQTVPNAIYTSQDAELACMRLQIDALQKMNAPQHEIDWALKQDGTFSDINRDGLYDKADYRKRDW
jgi:hypothetical protein